MTLNKIIVNYKVVDPVKNCDFYMKFSSIKISMKRL